MFGKRDQNPAPDRAGAAARLPTDGAGHRHASAARRAVLEPGPRRTSGARPRSPRPRQTPGWSSCAPPRAAPPTTNVVREQSDYYHATKTTIFNALLNTIDLSQLAQLDLKAAAEEIRDIVAELVAIKNVSMSVSEQEHLVQDIINDVLGYGPLEPLLARDDIADIMVNGAGTGVHRSRRQGPADQCPLPRQSAADEHLPADRQPGRPPRRRKLADLRRPPARRLARQRHRAAAWLWMVPP
jgi:pilus assembly protein CpaF